MTLIFCAQKTYHYPLIISKITKINFMIIINYQSVESLTRDPQEILQVVLVLIFCAQGSTTKTNNS